MSEGKSRLLLISIDYAIEKQRLIISQQKKTTCVEDYGSQIKGSRVGKEENTWTLLKPMRRGEKLSH